MIDELFFQVATLYGKRKAGQAVDKVAIKYLGEELSDIVDNHVKVMTAAGVAGAIPVVGGGIAATAVITSTWKMYYDINQSLGISFSDSFLQNVARGVISNLASNGVIVGAASVMSFFPGIGSVAAAVGMATANRAAIKLAAKLYLEMLKEAAENDEVSEGGINSLLDANASQKTYSGVIEYDNDKYEGEYDVKLQRNGRGTYYFKDGSKISGTWKDDNPINGTFIYCNGERYEGDLNEKLQRNGRGTYYFDDGSKISGTWKDDKSVNGTIYYTDSNIGDRYEGELNEKHQRHGQGTYYSENGLIRKGTWRNDILIHGTARLTDCDSFWYEGEFNEEGNSCGRGTYYINDGTKVSGTWDNNIPINVTVFYPNGDRYEGEFKGDNPIRHGKGTYYWKNGEKHSGDWQNDKRHGYGEYYDSNGIIIHKGIWRNDVSDDARHKIFPPVYKISDESLNPTVAPSTEEDFTQNEFTSSNTETSSQPITSDNVSTKTQSEGLSKKTLWAIIGVLVIALLIFGIKNLFNSSDSLYSTANDYPEESYTSENAKSIKDNPEVVKFAQDYLTSLITGDTATAHKYYPTLRNAEFENGTTSEINSVREEKTDNGIFNIVSFEGGWMKIAREDNEYIIVDSEGLFPYKRKIQDLESKYGVDLSIYKNLSETDLVESTTFTSLALSYDHSEIVEQKRTQEEAKETSIPSSMAADVLTNILSSGVDFSNLSQVHRFLERNGFSYFAPTINGKYYAKNCDCDVVEEDDDSYKCTPKNVNHQSVFVETDAYRGPEYTDITVWGVDNYNRMLEILGSCVYMGEGSIKGSKKYQSGDNTFICLYRDRSYRGEAYTVAITAEDYYY